MKQYNLTHLRRTLQITLATLLLLIGALTLIPVFHRHSGPSTGGARTVPGLETHVNHLTVNLLEYVANHPADLLTDIAREGKIISGLVEEYKNNLRADQLADFSRMDAASRTLREATLQIIAADNTQLEDKTRLTDLQSQLKSALEEMPQGSRRVSRQIGTAARLVVDIDAQQAKIEQDNLSKMAWFQKFLKAHEDISEVLQNNEPVAVVPTSATSGRHGFLASVIVILCLLSGLCIAGLEGLLKFRLFQPLKDLVTAADAAASGDLSRIPDIWAQDEVGLMAKALNRLITVLARSENLVYHLATLVDSSGDGIISQTLEGTILSWNKGAQRIYGYSAEEVKGQPITFLTPHEGARTSSGCKGCPYSPPCAGCQGAGQLKEVLERVKRGEKIQPFEMIHEGKNGRVVHVFLRVAGIYDSTRKVIGASISAQDLTAGDPLPGRATPPTRASGDYDLADAKSETLTHR